MAGPSRSDNVELPAQRRPPTWLKVTLPLTVPLVTGGMALWWLVRFAWPTLRRTLAWVGIVVLLYLNIRDAGHASHQIGWRIWQLHLLNHLRFLTPFYKSLLGPPADLTNHTRKLGLMYRTTDGGYFTYFYPSFSDPWFLDGRVIGQALFFWGLSSAWVFGYVLAAKLAYKTVRGAIR